MILIPMFIGIFCMFMFVNKAYKEGMPEMDILVIVSMFAALESLVLLIISRMCGWI